jgi:signal transduction histidine kinase
MCAEPALTLEQKESIYRIAQEALFNVIKHARAREVDLSLRRDTRGLTLTVEDDGDGFAACGTFPGRVGLRSMREWSAGLGGRLTITSRPGRGTRIRLVVPTPRARIRQRS